MATLRPKSEPIVFQIIFNVEILLLIISQYDRRTAISLRAGDPVGDNGQTRDLGVSDQREVIRNGQRHFGTAFKLKSQLRERHRFDAWEIETGAQTGLCLNVFCSREIPQLLLELSRHQIEHGPLHEGERGARVHDGAAIAVGSGHQELERNLHPLAADDNASEGQIVVLAECGVAPRRVFSKRRVAESVCLGIAGGAGLQDEIAALRRVVEIVREQAVGEFFKTHLRRKRLRAATEPGDPGGLTNREDGATDEEIGHCFRRKVEIL